MIRQWLSELSRFRRRAWHGGALTVFACGFVCLAQPFSLRLFGLSFPLLLTGVILMVAAARMPE